jgi:hypothetical protein
MTSSEHRPAIENIVSNHGQGQDRCHNDGNVADQRGPTKTKAWYTEHAKNRHQSSDSVRAVLLLAHTFGRVIVGLCL